MEISYNAQRESDLEDDLLIWVHVFMSSLCLWHFNQASKKKKINAQTEVSGSTLIKAYCS